MLASKHPYAETICISSSTNRIIRSLKRFLWLARQMARRNRIHSTMRDWLMLRSAVFGESRQRRTNPWTYRSFRMYWESWGTETIANNSSQPYQKIHNKKNQGLVDSSESGLLCGSPWLASFHINAKACGGASRTFGITEGTFEQGVNSGHLSDDFGWWEERDIDPVKSDKLSASGEAVELLDGDVMVELGKRMEVGEASGFCYCSAGGWNQVVTVAGW